MEYIEIFMSFSFRKMGLLTDRHGQVAYNIQFNEKVSLRCNDFYHRNCHPDSDEKQVNILNTEFVSRKEIAIITSKQTLPHSNKGTPV